MAMPQVFRTVKHLASKTLLEQFEHFGALSLVHFKILTLIAYEADQTMS